MRTVTATYPVYVKGTGKRSQSDVVYSDGTRARRCFAPHNPQWYSDSGGTLHPIDIGHVEHTANGKVGAMALRSRNVVSAGIRKDGNRSKYLGLRPDFDQAHGTEQLEFSVESIVFDGTEQVVDLSKREAISPIATDLGNVVIMSTRQRTRQMVRVAQPINSCRVEYTLHLKGLRIEYREDLDEYWIYSVQTGEFRFRIRRPCLVDPETYQPLILGEFSGHMPEMKHSLTDHGDGTCTYVKESAEDYSALDLPGEYYIDADVYYAETSDGFALVTSRASWSDCTEKSTADGVYADNANYAVTTASHTSNYKCGRGFLVFDTSDAWFPGPSCALNLYPHGEDGYIAVDNMVCVQKGTQGDALTVEDFCAFSGSAYGTAMWDADKGGYISIDLGSAGVSDINTSGNTYICVRDYNYDYGSVTPVGTAALARCYFSDNDGTDKDPYLEIADNSPQVNRRLSLLTVGLLFVAGPIPDSSVSEADRRHIAGIYSIDLASALAALSLDAMIQQVVTEGASLDALMQGTAQATADVDSMLSALNTTAVSIDAAAPAATVTATLSIDGIVQGGQAATLDLGAMLQDGQAVTASIDGGALSTIASDTTDIDAIVQATVQATAGADSMIQGEAAVTIGIDAVINEAYQSTLSLDAIIQDVKQESAGVDGVVKGTVQSALGLDASLQSGHVSTLDVGAEIQGSINVTTGADAIVQGTPHVTAGLGALISGTVVTSATLDAALMSGGTVTLETDAALESSEAAQTSPDAMIQSGVTATISFDAMLEAMCVMSFGIDAFVMTAGWEPDTPHKIEAPGRVKSIEAPGRRKSISAPGGS